MPSECWPVNLLMRVLFPTEGNPMKPTLATPVRATSNPAPKGQTSSYSEHLALLTTTTAATWLRGKQFTLQLCKLRLQLPCNICIRNTFFLISSSPYLSDRRWLYSSVFWPFRPLCLWSWKCISARKYVFRGANQNLLCLLLSPWLCMVYVWSVLSITMVSILEFCVLYLCKNRIRIFVGMVDRYR